MLGLPETTEFNKRIPKQKFYENINVTPALRRIFIDQIKVVYWRNKIAPSTINLEAGTDVTEIEVFEVKLNRVRWMCPSCDRWIRRSLTILFFCWNSRGNTKHGLRTKKKPGVALTLSKLIHIIIPIGYLRMSLL